MSGKNERDDTVENHPEISFRNIRVQQNDTYEFMGDILDLESVKDTDIRKFTDSLTDNAVQISNQWSVLYHRFHEMDRTIRKRDIEKGLGVKESTVTRFNTRVPAKRSYVIGLCIMYRQDFQNTVNILQRLNFRGLSPFDLDDCIYTYMLINNDQHMTPHRTFERYKKMVEVKLHDADAAEGEISAIPLADLSSGTITKLNREFRASMKNFDDFCGYIVKNRAYIGSSDARNLKMLTELISESGTGTDSESIGRRRGYANSSIKNSALREKYYRIRNGGEIIDRDFIILIALHMHKSREDIDQLLFNAGYNMLFKKDLLDLMVIYITEWLFMKAPKVFDMPESYFEYQRENLPQETEQARAAREQNEEKLYQKIMEVGFTNYIDDRMAQILKMPSIVASCPPEALKTIQKFRDKLRCNGGEDDAVNI